MISQRNNGEDEIIFFDSSHCILSINLVSMDIFKFNVRICCPKLQLFIVIYTYLCSIQSLATQKAEQMIVKIK